MKLGGRKRCGKCRSCGKTKKRFSHSALDLRSTLPTTPAATGPSSNTTFLLLPPEAGITKMKDGRTHLAYKAEHAVDLETGAVVAVTVATGEAGDTETMLETLPQAGEN